MALNYMVQMEKGIIVWDWNGTLLNDVDICVETMNGMLARRNLPRLTLSRYKTIFTFPVKDYYAEVGFDFKKESFDIVAMEFIDGYRERVKNAKVFKPVSQILDAFQNAGYRQFLISAMEHDFLKETLISNNVLKYFEVFSGLKDHYANGKVEMAQQVFKEHNINGSKIFFIGDTTHDYEVAEELGVKPVLIANGHQSEQRLKITGADILNDLPELLDYFQLKDKY